MKSKRLSAAEICRRPITMVPLALLCCLLWGGAFPALKLGYAFMGIGSSDVSDMILFAGVRFSLAGLLVILFYSLLQKTLLLPRRNELRPTLALGFCQTTTQYFFYYIGIAHLTGVKSSVMQGSTVFFTILLSCFLFRQERFSRRKLLSCLIGFSGILLANFSGLDLRWRWIGEGSFLLANILYGFSNCFTKRFSSTVPVCTLSGYQFFFGGLLLTLIGKLAGGRIAFDSLPAVLTFLYLICTGAIAQTVWSALLKYNNVSNVSIFTFSIPIFGVLLSALLLPGESVGVLIAVSLVLVCAGIALANCCNKN